MRPTDLVTHNGIDITRTYIVRQVHIGTGLDQHLDHRFLIASTCFMQRRISPLSFNHTSHMLIVDGRHRQVTTVIHTSLFFALTCIPQANIP